MDVRRHGWPTLIYMNLILLSICHCNRTVIGGDYPCPKEGFQTFRIAGCGIVDPVMPFSLAVVGF